MAGYYASLKWMLELNFLLKAALLSAFGNWTKSRLNLVSFFSLYTLGSCLGCKRGIPLGSGWGFNGWGRCSKCFRFTERSFAFCQNCGVGNNETIANLLKQISEEVQHIKRMEQERVTALQMENAAKDDEIRKLREIVAASEKVHFESLIQDDLEVSAGISQTGVNDTGKIGTSQQDGNVSGDLSLVRSKQNEEESKTD